MLVLDSQEYYDILVQYSRSRLGVGIINLSRSNFPREVIPTATPGLIALCELSGLSVREGTTNFVAPGPPHMWTRTINIVYWESEAFPTYLTNWETSPPRRLVLRPVSVATHLYELDFPLEILRVYLRGNKP